MPGQREPLQFGFRLVAGLAVRCVRGRRAGASAGPVLRQRRQAEVHREDAIAVVVRDGLLDPASARGIRGQQHHRLPIHAAFPFRQELAQRAQDVVFAHAASHEQQRVRAERQRDGRVDQIGGVASAQVALEVVAFGDDHVVALGGASVQVHDAHRVIRIAHREIDELERPVGLEDGVARAGAQRVLRFGLRVALGRIVRVTRVDGEAAVSHHPFQVQVVVGRDEPRYREPVRQQHQGIELLGQDLRTHGRRPDLQGMGERIAPCRPRLFRSFGRRGGDLAPHLQVAFVDDQAQQRRQHESMQRSQMRGLARLGFSGEMALAHDLHQLPRHGPRKSGRMPLVDPAFPVFEIFVRDHEEGVPCRRRGRFVRGLGAQDAASRELRTVRQLERKREFVRHRCLRAAVEPDLPEILGQAFVEDVGMPQVVEKILSRPLAEGVLVTVLRVGLGQFFAELEDGGVADGKNFVQIDLLERVLQALDKRRIAGDLVQRVLIEVEQPADHLAPAEPAVAHRDTGTHEADHAAGVQRPAQDRLAMQGNQLVVERLLQVPWHVRPVVQEVPDRVARSLGFLRRHCALPCGLLHAIPRTGPKIDLAQDYTACPRGDSVHPLRRTRLGRYPLT